MRINESDITNRLCYALLGIILGGIVSFFITRSAYSYKPQPVNVEITVKKDSVIDSKVTQKTISYNTESNDVKKNSQN